MFTTSANISLNQKQRERNQINRQVNDVQKSTHDMTKYGFSTLESILLDHHHHHHYMVRFDPEFDNEFNIYFKIDKLVSVHTANAMHFLCAHV